MIPAPIQVDELPMAGDDNGNCTKCGHPWGPHVLIATMVSAEHGGLIFCNHLGCECESTWSLKGNPRPYIPDLEEVAQLRALAQSEEDDMHEDYGGALDGDRDIEIG